MKKKVEIRHLKEKIDARRGGKDAKEKRKKKLKGKLGLVERIRESKGEK